jgi:hypothetical protein
MQSIASRQVTGGAPVEPVLSASVVPVAGSVVLELEVLGSPVVVCRAAKVSSESKHATDAQGAIIEQASAMQRRAVQ